MPRRKKTERGTRGLPWYRKFNDTWYVDYAGKQTAIKDGDGNNVKGAGNGEMARDCWVLMQAHMMAPEKGDENPVRLVFGKYLDHVKKAHADAYSAYKRTLVGFSESLPDKDILVRDLTAFHVDRWLEAHDDEWSSTTKATYIAVVMAALNWAAEPHRRLITANPIRGYKKPRRRSRGAEALIPEEAHQALLDNVPEDFALVLRVLRDTGTRPSNVCRVTAAHCDWDEGGWWFSEETAQDGPVHKTFEKTGEGLFVPVSEEVMALCGELARKHPEGPLFRTKEGEAWNSDKIAQRFGYYRTRLAKAGVQVPENLIAYGYRHTRLTELLEDGVSETVVAAIAGHKGTAMLHGHYSHILSKRKRLTETLRGHLKGRARNPQSPQGEGPADEAVGG